jgi:O-antigen chain-terminating methyltransferase
MPLLHARDAAEGKVAAIGSVNPRPGGLINALVQSAKRLVARALDWHVREQVEYNRAMVNCVEATMQALSDTNRAIAALAARNAELARELEIASELRDIRSHWVEWRAEWERKLSVNEVQFLRSAADLQASFYHRVALLEGSFRDLMKSQHKDFEGALERYSAGIQKRLWADLAKIREEYERVIHNELRVVRQRAAAAPPAVPFAGGAAVPAEAAPAVDWLKFADRFRGSEEYVRAGQRFYLPYFTGRTAVLDLGCGRGEFLELLREAGIPARGVDLSEESVALCRSKGLEAERDDLFACLEALPEGAADGIFCAQVVEHLPPAAVPRLVGLAAAKLSRGGLLAVETPNPECLAILATHFFLDPTHTRPIPPPLLVFYFEEAGFGGIEVHRFSPAAGSIPALASLPGDVREALFGGLDYAVIGRKL